MDNSSHSIHFAIAGEDFEIITNQLVVTPDTTTVPVDVAIYNNDSDVEMLGFKNFTLVLSTEENSARITTETSVVIIYDDDCKLSTFLRTTLRFCSLHVP